MASRQVSGLEMEGQCQQSRLQQLEMKGMMLEQNNQELLARIKELN